MENDIERRTVPGETAEQVEAEIQDLLGQLERADPTFQASVRTTCVREPFAISEEAPIVQTLARQAERLLGSVPCSHQNKSHFYSTPTRLHFEVHWHECLPACNPVTYL